MARVQNPAIAKVVSALAQGSAMPVTDGVLRQAVSPYTYDKYGGNFESVPGPSRFDQRHPEVDTSGAPSFGQSPLMTVTGGGPPRTQPGPMEGQMFGPPRLSHTGMEKDVGPLTTDPNAVKEMLLSMGIPEEMIGSVLREMGYLYGA